jgi:hypothetical protein
MDQIEMEERLIPNFSVKEFASFLAERFEECVSQQFEENKICGSIFLKLTEDQIGRMVDCIGDLVELQSLQSRVKEMLGTAISKVYLVLF